MTLARQSRPALRLEIPLPSFNLRFSLYMATLILMVPFYSISEILSAAGGVYGEFVGISLLKYTRELIFVIITMDFILTAALSAALLDGKARLSGSGLLLYLLLLTLIGLYTIRDAIWGMPISGSAFILRIFLIVNVGLIAYHVAKWYGPEKLLRYVTGACKTLILVNIPVSIIQILLFPAVVGTTFLGTRAYGTFVNPVLFSICLSTFLLFILLRRDKYWIFWAGICIFLSIASAVAPAFWVCSSYWESTLPSRCSRKTVKG